MNPGAPITTITDLALAWGAMLWFDITIFVLTLVQALRMRRHFPGGLLEVIFRDGELIEVDSFCEWFW